MKKSIQEAQAECQLLREDREKIHAMLSEKQVELEHKLKQERDASANQCAQIEKQRMEIERQRTEIESLASNLQFTESRSHGTFSASRATLVSAFDEIPLMQFLTFSFVFDTELSRYVQTLEQDQKLASEVKDHLEEQLHTQNREALRYYKVAKVGVQSTAGTAIYICT